MKRIICTVNESYEFVELEQFQKDAAKLKLTAQDIDELKHEIATRPPEASLGSGVFKFRWAPSRWKQSKRGATRTIYIEVIKDSRVYLVTIYAKNEKSDLTPNEEKAIRSYAKDLKKKGGKR